MTIKLTSQTNFGRAEPSHAIRSLDFDREVQDFVNQFPDGTVVNLGEGLETQRFRIQDNSALWLCVDLPDAIEIRERFITPDDRHLHVAVSATNQEWFNLVAKDKPVFISAQGLFMYFTEQQVHDLVCAIQSAFTHWYLMFDTIPKWLSNKTMSAQGWHKTNSYKTPEMPWGINRNDIQPIFDNWLHSNCQIADLGFSNFPRGLRKWLFYLATHIPIIKNLTPTIVKVAGASK